MNTKQMTFVLMVLIIIPKMHGFCRGQEPVAETATRVELEIVDAGGAYYRLRFAVESAPDERAGEDDLPQRLDSGKYWLNVIAAAGPDK